MRNTSKKDPLPKRKSRNGSFLFERHKMPVLLMNRSIATESLIYDTNVDILQKSKKYLATLLSEYEEPELPEKYLSEMIEDYFNS